MKKILSFSFLLILFTHYYSQLDTEHWFAPMIDRVSPTQFTQSLHQTLYFSTNETSPFTVSIYNNNAVIGTVNISKGNPQKFEINNREQIITTSDNDMFVPNNMGLYCKADKKFYANLRFSIYNHAEIITSKGKAGVGNKFYAAMAPLSVRNSILNFMTSLMATEDNTHITISGFNPRIVFSDGVTRSDFNFTLNKGQSYIIDGPGIYQANWDGFIGAKIESDKPVSVTNGNFNGQYAGNYPSSSDIIMDQSLPVERLGSEFAIVKGNGNIGDNTEGAIVVATENNTEIYLNDSLTPITTLQEGQYFTIPDTNYVNQGNNHYNLYIKTSKNVYVYQLLSGDSGINTVATCGFNYIPPLNCFLPKEIDEIGLIDENYVESNNIPFGILNIPTKLNVITEKDAIITINGTVPNINNGPFLIVGTNGWVTYSIPNISGNITVNSTKAVTAGISAGSDAMGYGGCFAGFSSIPVIVKKSGECVPGIVLEVDSSYDSYQWNLNGIPITGANDYLFQPIAPGNYTVTITNGSCTSITTKPYKVLNCTVYSQANYSICKSLKINPSFSTITATVNPTSVTIVSPPSKGIVNVNNITGEIEYSANKGTSGTDTFTYNFCSNNINFPDCETVKVNITIEGVIANDVILKTCNISGLGHGLFNLTLANVTSDSPVIIKYYPTLIDAENDNISEEILNFTAYPSPKGFVYAKILNPKGCTEIAKITLELYEYPLLNINAYNSTHCDDNLDGLIDIDFSVITNIILPNHSFFNIKYYLNPSDANIGNGNFLNNNWNYSTETQVFVRIESLDGCNPIFGTIIFKIGDRITLNTTSIAETICDNELDNIEKANLKDYTNNFSSDNSLNVFFFDSYVNAQNMTNQISNNIDVTLSPTNYFFRFESTIACPNIAILNIGLRQPNTSSSLKDITICKGTTTEVDAGSGFTDYQWSLPQFNGLPKATYGVGTHYVNLFSNGCVYKQYFTITEAPVPIIESVIVIENTLIVNVSGGTPLYEYSLDKINWQTSNVFTGLSRGIQKVYVRDKYHCNPLEREFTINNIINAITPNGDGINDVLDYSDLKNFKDVKITVYDRYGATVFNSNKTNSYTWNGTSNGRNVPTGTYWYVIEWTYPETNKVNQFKGWILVKNRE